MTHARTLDPRPARSAHRALPAAAVAILALALSSCGGSPSGPATDGTTSSPSATTSSSAPAAQDDASAMPSPSDTPTPSDTATAGPPSFADVDGTWCAADDATDCFTIALPRLDGRSSDAEYVYPAGDPTGDPSTWTYADLAPNADGCYVTAADGYPAMSGAEFIYCPAGAVSTEVHDVVGDSTVDRVFLTQELDATPFYRSGS